MFRHLAQTNQKYLDHFCFAVKAGFWLLVASVTSFVHAVFPDVWPFLAERITKRLTEQAQARQQRRKLKNANN